MKLSALLGFRASEGIPGGLARSSQNRDERPPNTGAMNDPLLTTEAKSGLPLELAWHIGAWDAIGRSKLGQ